jgi:hypothetical protein
VKTDIHLTNSVFILLKRTAENSILNHVQDRAYKQIQIMLEMFFVTEYKCSNRAELKITMGKI